MASNEGGKAALFVLCRVLLEAKNIDFTTST